ARTNKKAPFPFAVYTLICLTTCTSPDSKDAFLGVFLKLCWNLMCRAQNAVLITLDGMRWVQDSLGFKFAHTKTDQDGKHSNMVRHVFANPLRPEVCPILALAIFLLLNPLEEDQEFLFDGGHQYNRYQHDLNSLLRRELKDGIRDLGWEPTD